GAQERHRQQRGDGGEGVRIGAEAPGEGRQRRDVVREGGLEEGDDVVGGRAARHGQRRGGAAAGGGGLEEPARPATKQTPVERDGGVGEQRCLVLRLAGHVGYRLAPRAVGGRLARGVQPPE